MEEVEVESYDFRRCSLLLLLLLLLMLILVLLLLLVSPVSIEIGG